MNNVTRYRQLKLFPYDFRTASFRSLKHIFNLPTYSFRFTKILTSEDYKRIIVSMRGTLWEILYQEGIRDISTYMFIIKLFTIRNLSIAVLIPDKHKKHKEPEIKTKAYRLLTHLETKRIQRAKLVSLALALCKMYGE